MDELEGMEKARPPLLKAASKAKHGKLYAQLGQSYIQDEDWKNAEKYLVKAVEKGKLEKRESNTYSRSRYYTSTFREVRKSYQNFP